MNRVETIELIKCYNDPIYFIETYLMFGTPTYVGDKFKLYDYQKENIRKMHLRHFTSYYDGRQTGKTATAIGYIVWYACFNSDKTIGIASFRNEFTYTLLDRVYQLINGLPEFLAPKISGKNKQSVAFDNGTKILGLVTENSTRGTPLDLAYVDEADFVHNLREFMAVIMPALSVCGGKLIMSSTLNTNSEILKQYE